MKRSILLQLASVILAGCIFGGGGDVPAPTDEPDAATEDVANDARRDGGPPDAADGDIGAPDIPGCPVAPGVICTPLPAGGCDCTPAAECSPDCRNFCTTQGGACESGEAPPACECGPVEACDSQDFTALDAACRNSAVCGVLEMDNCSVECPGGCAAPFECSEGQNLCAVQVGNADGPGNTFGHAVDVWDTTIVVGEPGHQNNTGQAHVLDGGVASPPQRVASPFGPGAEFGKAVAAAPGAVAIAAPSGTNGGSVAIYDGGDAPALRLDAPQFGLEAVGAGFGRALAAGDNSGEPGVFIGVPGRQRVVNVWWWNAEWNLGQPDVFVPEVPSDDFGAALDTDELTNTLIIGAPGANRVEIWEFGCNQTSRMCDGTGNSWRRVHTITPPAEAAVTEFGRSVALSNDGNHAIIGARGSGTSGTAFVFVRRDPATGPGATPQDYTTGQWGQTQLVVNEPALGHAVATNGRFFISADPTIDGGTVGVWTEIGPITPRIALFYGPQIASQGLGAALAIDDRLLVIGARSADPNTPGRVIAFGLP